MNILDFIKNKTIYRNKYKTHHKAVIVSCFFNPTNSPYRTLAFNKFRESIDHLNHRIIECVIGDSKQQLSGKNVQHVYTKDLLWHKESLLNKAIAELPKKYKYVFWVDADVIFTNKNWLIEGVEALKENNIIQPFEYCVHLDQDQTNPTFNLRLYKDLIDNTNTRHPKLWRSFCSNYSINGYLASGDENYDKHGHVGFAWGARREILDAMPLYDRALIGGADHIMAHAAAGHINHICIQKSFTDNLKEVNEWSRKFCELINGRIGYVKGDLFHIWHGDIEKRQYLKRIQDFTPKTKKITNKDENGLYTNDDAEAKEYMEKYFDHREVKHKFDINKVPNKYRNTVETKRNQFVRQNPNADDDFINSLLIAYLTDSTTTGAILGGDWLGAMVGDSLNDSDEKIVSFGGGDFGGGGAGGSWDVDTTNNQSENHTNDALVFTVTNDTENFS